MRTILIIDDYPPLLQLYAQEFEHEDYEVVTATNLAEALRYARHYSFTAVIVEVTALLKEEFEMLMRALNQSYPVPLVLNTGARSRGAVSRADQLIDAGVAKATGLDPLKAVINDFVHEKRPLAEFFCAACRFYNPVRARRGTCLLTEQPAWPKWAACGDFLAKNCPKPAGTEDPSHAGP